MHYINLTSTVSLQLCKYNVKRIFSSNDHINIKWKNWRKVPEPKQHSWTYFLIWFSVRKFIGANMYIELWLKILKIINWKEFTVDSTNLGWELNPCPLFRYHTSRPSRSHRYCQYSLREQISECLYHI